MLTKLARLFRCIIKFRGTCVAIAHPGGMRRVTNFLTYVSWRRAIQVKIVFLNKFESSVIANYLRMDCVNNPMYFSLTFVSALNKLKKNYYFIRNHWNLLISEKIKSYWRWCLKSFFCRLLCLLLICNFCDFKDNIVNFPDL